MSRTGVPAVTLPPLLPAVLLWRNPIGQLSRWSRRHGDLFTVCLPSTGEVVVVGDPSVAHQILTSDPALSPNGFGDGPCVTAARRGMCPSPGRGPAPAATPPRQHRLPWRQRDQPEGADHRPRGPRVGHVGIGSGAGRPARHAEHLRRDRRPVLGLNDPTQVRHLHDAVRRLSSAAALAGTWLSPVADGWIRDAMCHRWLRRRSEVDRLLTTMAIRRRSAPAGGTDALSLLLAAHPAGGGDPPTHEDPAGNIHPLAEALQTTGSARSFWPC